MPVQPADSNFDLRTLRIASRENQTEGARSLIQPVSAWSGNCVPSYRYRK